MEALTFWVSVWDAIKDMMLFERQEWECPMPALMLMSGGMSWMQQRGHVDREKMIRLMWSGDSERGRCIVLYRTNAIYVFRTNSELWRVGEKMDLKRKGLVFTHAAIASANGFVNFPNAGVGTEHLGIGHCNGASGGQYNCVEVPVYSLDNYVDKYVKGNGPINILSIDVEGYDCDVLFGATSVLDRTHYLEFEYHEQGNWGKLHIQDAVRLLDGKGFTCYWAGKNKLWRISGCYFELRLFYQAHDVAIHGEMNPLFCLSSNFEDVWYLVPPIHRTKLCG